MSKKTRSRAGQTRDAPGQSWLCSLNAYEVLCGHEGYRSLTDCAEVRMCVDVYAELISSMTLYLMQNTEKGDVRVQNALSRKLDIDPHPLLTRKAWMHNIVSTMMLHGDGNQITLPIFSSDGLLERLEPLEPSKITLRDAPTGRGYYVDYAGTPYQPDEVLHFAINPDPERPWIGTGYKAQLRDVVRALRQANATKVKIMENPAPSIIVKVDGLTEEFSSKEGRQKLRGQYLDSSEAGEPWFIPADAFSVETVKPLSLNDLAIAKNLELDKRTMAGIIGVPAFLVGVGDFNAGEFNHFVATRIMPKAKVIEQVLTRGLLYAPDLYWRFNSRSLYSYSLNEIVAAGSAMCDRMAMRRNEWRDWMGIAPDDEMQELLGLENYLPVSRLGDQKKLDAGSDEQ